jgi:hypothetical protein
MQNYDSADDFIVNYSGWNPMTIFNVELEFYAFIYLCISACIYLFIFGLFSVAVSSFDCVL